MINPDATGVRAEAAKAAKAAKSSRTPNTSDLANAEVESAQGRVDEKGTAAAAAHQAAEAAVRSLCVAACARLPPSTFRFT